MLHHTNTHVKMLQSKYKSRHKIIITDTVTKKKRLIRKKISRRKYHYCRSLMYRTREYEFSHSQFRQTLNSAPIHKQVDDTSNCATQVHKLY